ncbi:hypothetical protein LCGC14_0252160 [marine sediment metagenome]|uniref:Uncharacterized protein n=1 Tax=marine sediment metagenome TaxID=412755 RepID=A0A0F9U951_9ZZZZ
MNPQGQNSRCTAQTFHRRRCQNRVIDADPLFCHRHSKDHAYERCGVIDRRSGRPCNRKAVEHGEPCAGHMPVTVRSFETGRFRG